MKIFLVTRGSHGDIFPYLAVAVELAKRGHDITLSLPQIFEKDAQKLDLNYVLQGSDDINGMIEGAAEANQQFRYLLKWIRKVISQQFEEFIPILQKHDILVSSNTEFSAVSIAEYCNKPIIRTAYAPLIPGKKIPPPIMPLSSASKVFSPSLLWNTINKSTNFMVRKTINKNRKKLGMPPIRDYASHAAGNAYNYLMHSQYLGSTDPNWEYKWQIGGYCFNNSFNYDEEAYKSLMDFIKKDERPILFFTLGSCDSKKKEHFCKYLLDVCQEQNYRLIIGTGWSKVGTDLSDGGNLFVLDKAVPHSLIFPHCDAIIHHGGSGTTHSSALAGKPQMIIPLVIDQDYWASRTRDLKVGPGKIKITIARNELREKITDLVTNPQYKTNASLLAKNMEKESGTQSICDYIESFNALII